MNCKNFSTFALLACAACSDDSGGEDRTPTDFSGDWLLTTTVVAKRLCDDNQPGDSSERMLSIEQDGSSVTLVFDDFSAS